MVSMETGPYWRCSQGELPWSPVLAALAFKMVLIFLVYGGINSLSLWISSLDFVSVFDLDCLLLFRLSGSLQGFPERQRCSKYMRFSSCFKSWIQKEE